MKEINLVFGSGGYIASNWKKNCVNKNFIFISKNKCDLTKLTEVKRLFKDYLNFKISIFMISAITRTMEDNKKTKLINIKMVENLVSVSMRYNISYFLFLSSTDIFSNKAKKPIKENSLINPTTYYAQYKYYAEKILKRNFRSDQLCIIRIPGIFGGKNDKKSTIFNIYKSIKKNSYQFSNVIRSYIFINDLVNFLNQLSESKLCKIINFCDNRYYTINELYGYFFAIMKIKYVINEDNIKKKNLDIFFDNDNLKKYFPYFKFTSINLSLKTFI